MPADPSARSSLLSVSVVIRSYQRRESLLRILKALRAQDHPDFEVIVVEQSGFDAVARQPLDELARDDPRFKLHYSEPLGVGGARDAGWRLASREIVLAIDDDDVPLGHAFVSSHARNYLDANVVAVTGRHVYSEAERCGYARRGTARRRCLSYNFFGYPHAYCRLDERIESVQWVHGSNGSVRKSVIERVGGWDPRSVDFDEHPFCLPLQRLLRAGERLVFDPTPVLLRSKDIPGGAGVRYCGVQATYRSWFRYYHRVVFKHRPLRSLLFYPLLPLASCFSAARWVWTDSKLHRGVFDRLRDTCRAVLFSPSGIFTSCSCSCSAPRG
jgi:glycosyltransferase involved in cell wall biosynthesis